jgi:hypothetical protein
LVNKQIFVEVRQGVKAPCFFVGFCGGLVGVKPQGFYDKADVLSANNTASHQNLWGLSSATLVFRFPNLAKIAYTALLAFKTPEGLSLLL